VWHFFFARINRNTEGQSYSWTFVNQSRIAVAGAICRICGGPLCGIMFAVLSLRGASRPFDMFRIGYTLLVTGGTFITGYLFDKLPYEPLRDFAPITLTHRQPNILVVHPSLPVKSVKALIAFAKAKPGELNYASSGVGSTNHLSGELFNVMAGTRIVRINYKGVGPAVTALLGGEVHLMYANLAAVSPHLQAGRLRPLAITSAEPSALRPGLPTMAASGLPGFETIVITGVYAPVATPAVIVNRLHPEIVRAIHLSEIKERFSSIGIETVGSSPQELTAAMKAKITRTARLIKEWKQ
jgi:tripartite-type tricarboxylate transporter receptor subunit TctC